MAKPKKIKKSKASEAARKRKSKKPVADVFVRLVQQGIVTPPRSPGRASTLSRAERRALADRLGNALNMSASDTIIADRGPGQYSPVGYSASMLGQNLLDAANQIEYVTRLLADAGDSPRAQRLAVVVAVTKHVASELV